MKARIVKLKSLKEYSLRDLLTVGLPALLLLAGGFWLAAQFIKPAPPKYLYLSSGAPGGSYEVYAERYRQVLAKNGVELRDRPSAGAMENLKRLLDENDDTEVALVQSGIANGANIGTLYSLGFLYYEPLWVFYRGGQGLDRLTQLRGRRLAVGAEGSASPATSAIRVLNTASAAVCPTLKSCDWTIDTTPRRATLPGTSMMMPGSRTSAPGRLAMRA